MAIALVAHVAKTSSGTSGAIDTTGANFLVLVAGAGGTAIPAVSDSKSNTWQIVGQTPSSGTNSCAIYISYPSSVGASHTFTVTNGTPSFCVAAFSGVATNYALDKVTAKNSASSGTSIQAGSITPSVANSLVVAGFSYRDTTTVSIDGSFTISDQNPFIGGTAIGSVLAYLIQTSAAAANPTWSWTNSAANAAISIAIQPPSSGGGSAPLGVAYIG